MKKILFLMLFIFCACNDEGFIALNSKEAIVLKYNAKEKALKGQNDVFMLFFYSKDCGICKEQIPILNELSKEHKIIAVLGGMKDYLQAKENYKGVVFPVIFAPLDVEYLSNVVGGVYGVPAMFIYDKNGKLVSKHISLTPKSVLKRAFAKANIS